MQRIIIICEGETEQEFCKKTLYPHFFSRDFIIQNPLIKKSMGGIVNWNELRKQVQLHLENDTEAFVTLLIDYYGIYTKHNFPGWDEGIRIPDKNARIDFLELAMAATIEDRYRYRFIPNMQLHEFEGLLFNDIDIFYSQIPASDIIGKEELVQTFAHHSNPEMINDSKTTSPSHRLGRIIKGYNKIVYGNILAEAIGLQNLRAKSPRFNNWLDKLEKLKLD